ncbi:MAG: HD domain-containing protein [Thermotogaceae bacterium]|nr:HD domain-containing protein [Thermotogaceae bacterium]
MEKFIWVVKELMLYSVPVILLAGLLPLLDILSYKKEKKLIIGIFVFAFLMLLLNLYFHNDIITILVLLISFIFAIYLERKISKSVDYKGSNIIGIVLLGIILAAAALIMRSFDLQSITYTVAVVGVALVMAFSKHYSFLSEVIFALTIIPVIVFYDYAELIYPQLMLISTVVSLNGLGMNIKEVLSERAEPRWEKFNSYLSTVFAIVLLFAFVGSSVVLFDRLYLMFQKSIFNVFNTYSDLVYHHYKVYGESSLENIVNNQLPVDFVKKIYIVKDGRTVYPPGSKEREWEDYVNMKKPKNFTFSRAFPDGTKVLIVYESNKAKSLLLLLIYIIVIGVFIAAGMFVMNHIYYRKWTNVLEGELVVKTQEISAINEELVAMNEELTAMNGEVESMYKSLSRLNKTILEFLNFLKEIDIKEDILKIFDNLYHVLNKVLSVPLSGYEVLDSEGNARISKIVYSAQYSTDMKIGGYIFRIFLNEPLKISSDEEKFMEMLSLILELTVTSHENYCTLEKSKNFLSSLLELVSVISTSSSIEEVEEAFLRKGLQLFDDTVLVALAWKKDEKDVVTAKLVESDDNKIVEKKVTSGIVKYSLSVGEEYIVGDVSNDPVFYIVTPKTKSAVALPLISNEGVIGVFEIERSTKNAFTDDDLRFLRIFASITAITLQRLRYAKDLKETLIGLAEALSYAIELKDSYTHGHSRRVADYSVEIAKELGFPDEKIEEIELAAILHDVGKIGIKGIILNKPGKLTDMEFEDIKKHPIIGEELVGKVKTLKHIAKIIRHHHERCDGKGYPDGLTCEEIPIESRILAVADAFDAMTTDRPYRKAYSVDRALKILESGKGKQWDKKVVEAAIRVFERKLKVEA